LESYKMCHDVEVVRDWVHAYSFKDEGSCPGAFAQQRWGLMPWEYIYAQSDEGLCPRLVPHAWFRW